MEVKLLQELVNVGVGKRDGCPRRKGKAGSGRESRAKPVEGKVWHRAGANDGDSHLSSGKTSVMSKNLILVSKKAE